MTATITPTDIPEFADTETQNAWGYPCECWDCTRVENDDEDWKPMLQPDLDVPLLRKLLDHIEDNPTEWDQGNYAVSQGCNTAYCVAGWAVVFTGHVIEWLEIHPDDLSEGEPAYAHGVRVKTGQFISDVAQRELGLSTEAAERLFWGGNTLDDLWKLAEIYSGGEIARPLAMAA